MGLFDFPNGKIRLLPMEPISCNNGKYTLDTYTGIMWTEIPLGVVHPKSVIKIPNDFDSVSKPPPLPHKTQVTVREVIGCTLPDIPYSRHRSKRVLKKLRKRLSASLLGPSLIMNLPTKILDELKIKLDGQVKLEY